MTIQMKREAYEKIFQEAINSKEIEANDAEDLSYILSGLFDGLSTLYYEKTQDELKQLYRQAITYFLRGVLPR